MTPQARAEKIGELFGFSKRVPLDKEAKESIAAQIEEAEREAVAEIAAKQALIYGESVMLGGKLVTNEELYKQPTDYIKEAKEEIALAWEKNGASLRAWIREKEKAEKAFTEGYNTAKEQAAKICEDIECLDEDHQACVSERIRAMQPDVTTEGEKK